MTTEEDFQRHLDENPFDFTARMVFADWLDEQGDPRAAGYRELGRRKRLCLTYCNRDNRTCSPDSKEPKTWSWWDDALVSDDLDQSLYRDNLGPDWFSLLTSRNKWTYAKVYKTRREAEDDAAIAYLKLQQLKAATT